MKDFNMKKACCVLGILFLCIEGCVTGESKAPHIIIILADDLGWNDVSFHGSKQIPTPNIDILAYTGIILNNYYVQPLCTPSRGSLMTGKYPIKLGLQHLVIRTSEPWGLSLTEKILPQYFKELGYSTHGVGKWHLGYFHENYLPTRRGFDSFFGYWNSHEDYFTHIQEYKGKHGLDFHDNERNAWGYYGHYGTDVFTQKAIKTIENHNASKPLFLYLAHQAVHTGTESNLLQAPDDYTVEFSYIENDRRRTYAGMVSALDQSVGEIVAALNRSNMLENCVIIFSTDNGGASERHYNSSGSNFPLRSTKSTLFEGGVRGTGFIWSPSLFQSESNIYNGLMHITDWLPTLYSLAGGNTEELGEIDGYNFWPSISSLTTSPRQEVLLNIDPVWQLEGVRKGSYKLVKGSPPPDRNLSGWDDKEGKNVPNIPFSKENLKIQDQVYTEFLKESEAFKVLFEKNSRCNLKERYPSRLKQSKYADKLEITEDDEIKVSQLFEPVIVNCGGLTQNHSVSNPTGSIYLFDIAQDPCEYNNVARDLPSVVKELEEVLEKYRREAVPIRNKEGDPRANPAFHGYAWVPWIK